MPKAASKVTVTETIQSLTGFEEIAIAKHFEHDISTLLDAHATMAGRALVFTIKTREGKEPRHAKTEAMAMTLQQVNDYFAEDEDEPMPEDPITEQGKEPARSA